MRRRLGLPDYSDLPLEKYEWTSIYGNIAGKLPSDMPVPWRKPVITTTYEDANLYHDYLTGRSVTGSLHLVNQTPIDWYCKIHATVEMASYGSEFNAARTATEQIMDMQYTLHMLGVPIIDSYGWFHPEGTSSRPHAIQYGVLNFHSKIHYPEIRKYIQ